MLDKMIVFMPILASGSLDALENKIRVSVALTFIAFIVIPILKFLFGKKDD